MRFMQPIQGLRSMAKAEIKALGHERMRSYSRRELCNDVLAQYGEARHTNPKGEKYGLVQFSDMNMLTFCVDPANNQASQLQK